MKTHAEAIAYLTRLATEWRRVGERLIFVIRPDMKTPGGVNQPGV